MGRTGRGDQRSFPADAGGCIGHKRMLNASEEQPDGNRCRSASGPAHRRDAMREPGLRVPSDGMPCTGARASTILPAPCRQRRGAALGLGKTQ